MNGTFSFIGEATHNLDDKGRLALPGKFREELQRSERPEEMVAYASERDGKVTLYSHEQWQKIEEAINGIADNFVRQAAAREFGFNSERLSLDKTGRVLLSPKHRAIAGLEREVVVVGAISKVEIWESGRLQAQRVKDEAAREEALRSVALPL